MQQTNLDVNSIKPLISVITVVFNGEQYIEETILNVLSQTYTNVEYLIIDGGSSDGTLNIIKKHQQKIKLISEPDHGIYDAMNKGVSLSSGDWIIFINAGDSFYEQETLEKLNSFIQSNYATDLIFGDVNMVLSNGKSQKRILHNKILFLVRNMICHQCILYSKNIFNDIGLFDTKYKLSSDFEHFIRARSFPKKILKINEVIANYSLDGISAQKQSIKKIWKERLVIFTKRPNGMNIFHYLFFRLYALASYLYRRFY
jgi:glycosyltransferase involved in cell wall biosynthesis